MADEALSSFTMLLESVPGWIVELERILGAALERQHEVLAEHQPAEDQPKNIARNPSISSSLRLRRSVEVLGDVLPAGESHNTLLRPQIPHMTASDALRLAQRKRKTASVCSDHHSGPSKHRSTGLTVIFYDGEIQKRFEKLVRAVGTCRNSLRKGKMGAKVDALSHASFSGSDDGSSGDETETAIDVRKLNYKPARARSGLFGRNDGTQAFDLTDGFLEKAQALCERAAHQVLRDGDCAAELTTAKDRLADAQRLAKTELPALRKRAEKAAERRRRSEDRRRVEDASRPKTAELADERLLTSGTDLSSSSAGLEVDLEADDSDGEQHEFNVSTVQLSKFPRRASARGRQKLAGFHHDLVS